MSFAADLHNKVQSRRKSGAQYNGTPVYDLSVSDAKLVENLANKFGFPPQWLANLISFESGATFNPAIQNSIGATGLIQFMPSTAKGLGTSTSELRKMSFRQQMGYVEKYLRSQLEMAAAPKGLYNKQTGKVTNKFTQTDLFMLIFYPVAVGDVNYKFPSAVVKANNGISTPKDYTNRVLIAGSTPYKEISPYLEVAAAEAVAFTKRNKWPIILIGTGLVGVMITLTVIAAKSNKG